MSGRRLRASSALSLLRGIAFHVHHNIWFFNGILMALEGSGVVRQILVSRGVGGLIVGFGVFMGFDDNDSKDKNQASAILLI